MSFEERPPPEHFLEAANQEISEKSRGRLKIFIGMAAGVGKTYAMLQEAQKLYKEGINILVGVVDTHQRPETAEMLKNLPTIPQKQVTYKDRSFEELDIDTILQLKPEVVLIDELAHSNVPGSRHARRWEDVLEILDHGIDVYTTLNVQHIESLNDVIKGVTDISVREPVPDLLIEKAASIRLVDLPPDELLVRLEEGKVYLGNQSQVAIQHFFQKDRLTALREIVLRYAADKVDRDLRGMIPIQEGSSEWKPRESFLVAVSQSPHSQKLIRVTRRLAASVDAPWTVVNVNSNQPLNDREKEQLEKNLSLARHLGADLITINDPDIANGIKRVAYQRGVTQIILGRPPKKPFLGFFTTSSVLDRLAAECKGIDIHVIRQDPSPKKHQERNLFTFNIPFSSYFVILIWALVLTAINLALLPYIGYKTTGMVFLFGILLLSLFSKRGPIIFASLLFAFIWALIFVPPPDSLYVSSREDIALLIIYLITALTVSYLVNRARQHKEMLEQNEASIQTLYEMARLVATTPSIDAMLQEIKVRLDKSLKGTTAFLIKQPDGTLNFNDPEKLISTEKEKTTALWAFDHAQETGWSTDTLPASRNLYMPLRGFHEIVGLLVYRPKTPVPLSEEEKNFLYTITHQLSSRIERAIALAKSTTAAK